jgi:hypothetical protein
MLLDGDRSGNAVASEPSTYGAQLPECDDSAYERLRVERESAGEKRGVDDLGHVGSTVVVVVRVSLALGLALVLMTGVVSAENPDQSANGLFRVTWEPRTDSVAARTIQGHVYNDSPLRVTDVRLQVEGLGADDHPVGKTFAWALGDIVPSGETSFVVDSMPGAVTYRIGVVSYDVVSSAEAP